ncbi:MAG: glycosyl hydrolase family 28 protein [Bacteroidales bacterium]|nr:glycosyl hydrolase family 28 protein [Bacteroidales bacterium]
MKKTIFILFAFLAMAVHAEVITWKAPEGFASDKYYQVKVNGINVPVFDTPIASYAVFDFTGEVTVEVNTMYDVRWVDIRPMRMKLKPEYTGDNSFSFKLSHPCNVSVELNGRIRQQPLFIFSNAPEKNKPSKKDKNVIWFEEGKLYKDVALELKDNQTAYIEGGAVVQGHIWAEGRKNVKIMGRGIMDGQFVRQMSNKKKGFISLQDCDNVTVEDIILHNASTWQIVPWNSNDVTIRNARIVSEHGGDDGMDIVRCTNVLIDGVFAHTKDDCIAIKSHGPYPSTEITDNILVKNCTFWNSIWGNAIEIGFELFSDEVKNIRFENCDIIHVEDGATISIHNADRAKVSNITFEDIRIEDSRQKLFDIAIFYSQWSSDGIRDPEYVNKNYVFGAWDGIILPPSGIDEEHMKHRGTVSNVLFKDIQVVDGLFPFSVFYGYDEQHNVDGVTIENLTFHGKKITTLEDAKVSQKHAKNITIK